jgi:hypothetical protein
MTNLKIRNVLQFGNINVISYDGHVCWLEITSWGLRFCRLFNFVMQCTNSKTPFDEMNFDIGISYGR